MLFKSSDALSLWTLRNCSGSKQPWLTCSWLVTLILVTLMAQFSLLHRLCLCLSDCQDLQTSSVITHAGLISFWCSDCTTYLVDCWALSHTEKERNTKRAKNTQTNKKHYKVDPNILVILSSDCICILVLLDPQSTDGLITSNWHHCPVFHVSLIFAYFFSKKQYYCKTFCRWGTARTRCLCAYIRVSLQVTLTNSTNWPAEHLAVDLSLKATGECWFCWCETSPSDKRTLYVHPPHNLMLLCSISHWAQMSRAPLTTLVCIKSSWWVLLLF